MISWWRKFVLILHKHLLIRVHHYFLTAAEIMLPISVALMLAWFKRFENEFLEMVNPELFGKNAVSKDEYFSEEDPLYLIRNAIGLNISVFITPNNTYTQSLIRYCYAQLKFLPVDTVTFFGIVSEREMNYKQMSTELMPSLFLIFDANISLHVLPMMLKYGIFFQEKDRNLVGTAGISIQHLVALHFMKNVEGYEVLSRVKFLTQRLPMPEMTRRGNFVIFLTVFFFGYMLPFCFIFTIPIFLIQIVMEKQTGIKELMRMMGLPISIQWMGFFVNSFVTMFISSAVIVLLLTTNVIPSTGGLLKETGPGHLLIIFTLYILSCICLCFFLSTLCSDVTKATLIGVMVWCLSFMTPFLITNAGKFGKMNTMEQLFFSLIPNMALFWTLRLLAILERQDGLKWQHYYSSPTLAEDLFLAPLLAMFLVDIVVYLSLGWYLDQLFPGPFGVPQPWYFLLQKSYWLSCGRRPSSADEELSTDSSLEEEHSTMWRTLKIFVNSILKKLHLKTQRATSAAYTKESGNFEGEPNLPIVVEVVNLTKVFRTPFAPPFVAVNGINLKAYRGEILVLLGHNGAGKTVTMSMITGTYFPTRGSVYVRGYSMKTQRNNAREGMGFCPQHAVYFPELSVMQHLAFFGRLKGLRGATLDEEVEYLLRKLKLWEQRAKRGNQLSGGMLRRLQLGIATIGEVYLIILDEPTSGLDPEARRLVWDLLLEIRSWCCILLTTHFMEEADALGDRIAIMSHGRIICCGTPMFLRNRFGSTYMMKINKAVGCKENKVLATVRRYVPDATTDSNTHTEMSIALSTSSTRVFADLFHTIEANLDDLKISSFGLSTMGLEEVFLKVNEAAEKKITKENPQKREKESLQLAASESAES